MDLQNRRVKRTTWCTTDDPAADYDRYCECQADEDEDEDEDEEDDDQRREIEAERRAEAAEDRAAARELRNYDPFGGP